MSIHVLEEFRGKVVRMKDNVAFVRLEDRQGRLSSAQCDALKLQRKGIEAGDLFTYTILETEIGSLGIFARRPRRKLTPQEWSQIHEETGDMLSELPTENDY